MGIFPCR